MLRQSPERDGATDHNMQSMQQLQSYFFRKLLYTVILIFWRSQEKVVNQIKAFASSQCNIL
ncbi:MAG: hypothetical protein A2511_17960 [Deltaproteobacteria bacterium RIFOXYD12_FULL_50_9]|nr:MAG: hypothetical protein A2511_17960 [Deltaproteobacteria bacterium RIFOXYD12_FULL_50_9]